MTKAPSVSARLRFGPDYEEVAFLDDGTPVTLRLIRPDDGPLLRKGFEELSAASRYLRFFFRLKSSLSSERYGTRWQAVGAY